MKRQKRCPAFILLISIIAGWVFSLARGSEPGGPFVYVVMGFPNANGADDQIEKIPWASGLTVQDAVVLTRSDPKYTCVLLSNNGSTIYGGRALTAPPLPVDQVRPGDVIVMGVVDKDRGEELDRISLVRNRLGTRWADYKNWMRRG